MNLRRPSRQVGETLSVPLAVLLVILILIFFAVIWGVVMVAGMIVLWGLGGPQQ